MTIKKRVAILAEEAYQVLEVWYPLLRLKEEGFDVQVVGSGTQQTYGSKEGYPVDVDRSIEDVQASDFDAVIIPGGWAPDFLRRSSQVVSFVKELDARKKIVASICHGGWLLVSAGILRNKKATSFFAIKDDLIAGGAHYCDAPVVVDGHLITSRKPDDLPLFMKEIIRQLQ